jgi:rare lipoprotein A
MVIRHKYKVDARNRVSIFQNMRSFSSHILSRQCSHRQQRKADALKSILIRTLSVGIVFSAVSLSPQAQALTWSGKASYYSGRGKTANGGHVGASTAAHRSLPFGTKVMVTNLANGRSTVVTINDRGPFVRGRIIDVSVGAAGALGMRGRGVAPVRVSTL